MSRFEARNCQARALPPPLRGRVWTGDKVDGRSGTWWTHFSSLGCGLLLLLRLWTLWATRSGVHKSTGFGIGLAKVDGPDAMGAEVHGEDPVLAGRAQGDQLAPQAFAHAPVAVPEN
jgi:hypothetical protein